MSKPDVQALLAAARRPERTVALCLRGDLQAQVEELERQLAEAEEAPGDKLSDGTTRGIAQQIEAVRAEMTGSTVVFRLQALTRRAWADLVAAHPAKDGDKEDESFGFHADTFFPALVQGSTVEPRLEPAQWDTLLDEALTSRQFEELVDTALALNRRPVDVPFSFAASRTLRNSGPK